MPMVESGSITSTVASEAAASTVDSGSTMATVSTGSNVATAASSSVAEGSPPTSGTIFFDDFDGSTLDPEKWTVFDRLSDQANDEVNCLDPQNVSVSDGLLQIVSKAEDRSCGDALEPARTLHYTSGQVQQATPPFLYGTIEVRAKMPGGIGTWPVIWMLGFEWQASQPFTTNVEGHQWPKDGWAEIDIAEFLEGERNQVNTNVHYQEFGGTNLQPLPFDSTTRFMVYRLEWSPGSLVWSVDAEDGQGFRELRTVTGEDQVPDDPMYLVIHTAIGGFGGGEPDPATFPQTMQVDWARITQ